MYKDTVYRVQGWCIQRAQELYSLIGGMLQMTKSTRHNPAIRQGSGFFVNREYAAGQHHAGAQQVESL